MVTWTCFAALNELIHSQVAEELFFDMLQRNPHRITNGSDVLTLRGHFPVCSTHFEDTSTHLIDM